MQSWPITIAASIATSLIMMGVLELCLRRDSSEPTHPRFSPGLKFAGGAVAIGLGLISNDMNVLVLELLLLLPIAVQMGYGLYVWFSQDLAELEKVKGNSC